MLLGSHWLHPDRDLHGRLSFSVELLYLHNASAGFDWQAAQARVQMVLNKGAKVALRVDWKPGQALPPEHDEQAARQYVQSCQNIAADPVFRHCDWMICGNEPNLAQENQDTGRPMQAWWPARIVFGHTLETADTGNVYQYVRSAHPTMQVLLPAVAPYTPGIGGGQSMPDLIDGRSEWSPWEQYQFDLMVCAYDNDWHAEMGEVKTAVHTYGCPWVASVGPGEPWTDQREQLYRAQFGTRWLQDCLLLLQKAQQRVYGSEWAAWVLVTECNVYRPPQTPENDYPGDWWRQVVAYANSQPNIMGIAAFCDQDYGGNWGSTSMTAQRGREPEWNTDHEYLLANGF